MNSLFYAVPVASIIALVFAYIFYSKMKKEDEGTPTMKQIAQYVREGAMAYLKQQYKIVVIVFIVLAVFFAILAYGFHVQNTWVPFAFLTGGFFSGLAGFIGMRTATYASGRTANAARRSLNAGLKVAFRSGAVMGLTVVGLGLLDIALWWIILNAFVAEADAAQKLVVITTTMLTFGMGASTQALFARVGGGIYTKAADVGADLVGKVESDLPEDDPRNPATIADNVGDNVGDVAGMGADLYESYCGSILSTMALGASAFFGVGPEMQTKAILAPMLIAAVGVVLSIIGIFVVRTKEGADMGQLLKSMSRGTNLAAILSGVATFGILALVFGTADGLWWRLSLSVVSGLIAGVIIGKATEYYTSHSYKPTQKLAAASETGPATVIINGIGLGMISTAIPVITIAAAIVLSYLFATGFDIHNLSLGLYGVAIAAVGMLSTLGITLATDAYGPIADNAGGNAEMSELEPFVRERTDVLDALGNTTAATGKGFAIGSAALTALALIASYIEEIKIALARTGEMINGVSAKVDAAGASILDVLNHYNVTIMNPAVLAGVFIGAMMAFLFCGMTMNAVGRAASKMVVEVRRQFREIKGILTREATPDYGRCVEISTKAAQHEMVVPALIAIITPILTGVILGVAGVIGLLFGGLGAGFVLAVFMSNSGGAWDNAKKYVEEGHFGGKGSECHHATVVGDTVGDPFKDTSGPSLNILIKLMSMVSIVMAGLTAGIHLIG
ncbi:MAG: sodium-translocating pyrophosphatase [Bacteroidales bacterium]|nr:sodium-translocating pyrophosphatase [Bacteroidales bacterium]